MTAHSQEGGANEPSVGDWGHLQHDCMVLVIINGRVGMLMCWDYFR